MLVPKVSKPAYLLDRRDVIRTRGLRFAPVGAKRMSTGHHASTLRSGRRNTEVHRTSCAPLRPNGRLLLLRLRVRISTSQIKKYVYTLQCMHIFYRSDVIRTRDLCVPNTTSDFLPVTVSYRQRLF